MHYDRPKADVNARMGSVASGAVTLAASTLGIHAIRFTLTDELTGAPLARQPVAISYGGKTINQVTDDEGSTEFIYTRTAPSHVKCTVLGIDDLFRDSTHG
jgi:hypothetical protein